MDKHESLIKNKDLYPPEFVERFGTIGANWERENWAKRERSLCHDMVCILLANSEPRQNLEIEIINSLKRVRAQIQESITKKPRLELDPIEEDEANSTDAESDGSTGVEYEDISDIEESDIEYHNPMETFENEHESQFKFRYIVLEGLSAAAQFQNHFCEKWQIERYRRLFDIVDTTEKKLIEIKVTVSPEQRLKEFQDEFGEDPHCAAIIVSIDDFQVDYHNKDDGMPGINKVLNFLTLRKAHMRTAGLFDKLDDEGDLDQLVFSSPRIIEYLNEMNKHMGTLLVNSVKGDIPTEGFRIEEITKEDLFSKLKDPLQIKSNKTIEWKGKLTPAFYCDPIELDDERDEYAVDLVLSEDFGDATLLKGDSSLLESVKYLQSKWFTRNREERQFGFIDINDKAEKRDLPSIVKEAFMIGKKSKTYSTPNGSMKQKERAQIKEQNYDRWFETTYCKMGENHIYTGTSAITCMPEEHSQIPLYNFLGRWIEQFYIEVARKNVALVMNQVVNFFSRASGSYNTTIGGKTTHSKIAAIPLKITLKGKEIVRLCTGICFRGPHHMKSPTDKSNLLIVERLGETCNLPKNFYSKPTIIRCGNGQTYLIRKTAIKKVDGVHLTFIENSLFMATNMIGDTLFNHPSFSREDDFKNLCQAFLTNDQSKNFYVDRVIDAVMMALIGNSRDEGFLNVFRKLLMIGINERRGESSFTFNIEGMCKKINECVIDNPIGMHLMITFRYCLCKM